jgi:hypothetical protein
VLVPVASAVTSPDALMFAVKGLLDAHAASLLTPVVVPSL